MKMPAHKIPARKEWRTLRDKAGGKKGLSKKANVGPSLDKFHKVYAACVKKEALGDLPKALNALDKEVKTYITDVTKDHKKVATAATTKLKKPIDDLSKKMAAAAQAEHKKLNAQVTKIDNGCKLIEKGAKKVEKVIETQSKIADPLWDKYRRKQVPEGEKKQFKAVVEKLRKTSLAALNAYGDLRKELDSSQSGADPEVRKSRKKQINDAGATIRNLYKKVGGFADQVTKLQEKAK